MEGGTLMYRCHKDICDSTWQYCDEDEKRCSACTQEQCSAEAAKKIFNQCSQKCQEWFGTTVETISTTLVSKSNEATCYQGLYDIYIFGLLIAILLLILGYITFQIINYLKNYNDLRGSRNSLMEKGHFNSGQNQPLMYYHHQPDDQWTQLIVVPSDERKLPIQINSQSDHSSNRVDNMVRDADILNDAIVGGSGSNSMTASLHHDL